MLSVADTGAKLQKLKLIQNITRCTPTLLLLQDTCYNKHPKNALLTTKPEILNSLSLAKIISLVKLNLKWKKIK